MARKRKPPAPLAPLASPTPEDCLKVLGEFARNLIVDPAYLQRVRNRAMDGKLDSRTEGMLIQIGVMGVDLKPPAPPAPVDPGKKRAKLKTDNKVVSITKAKEPKP